MRPTPQEHSNYQLPMPKLNKKLRTPWHMIFLTRLIGSAVDTQEASTRQAKRVRGQQM